MTESEWKAHQKKYGGVLTENQQTWYSSAKALKGYTDKTIGKLAGGKTVKDFEDVKDFLRPNMIRIFICKNVRIQDVTFENSPAWTTHIQFSEHITIKNLTVKNPWYGANTDALDLESCKNALVEDCHFDTGDDGITVVNGSVFKKEFALLHSINEREKYVVKIKSRGKAANSDHYWFTEKGVPSFFIYAMGGIQAYHDVYDKGETLPLTDFEDLFNLIIKFYERIMD